MKRTNVTGQTCVGDLRLSPLDVGFDPRRVGFAIELPAEFRSVGIEQDGQVYLIEGSREEMIGAIREAGYAIADMPAESI